MQVRLAERIPELLVVRETAEDPHDVGIEPAADAHADDAGAVGVAEWVSFGQIERVAQTRDDRDERDRRRAMLSNHPATS